MKKEKEWIATVIDCGLGVRWQVYDLVREEGGQGRDFGLGERGADACRSLAHDGIAFGCISGAVAERNHSTARLAIRTDEAHNTEQPTSCYTVYSHNLHLLGQFMPVERYDPPQHSIVYHSGVVRLLAWIKAQDFVPAAFQVDLFNIYFRLFVGFTSQGAPGPRD